MSCFVMSHDSLGSIAKSLCAVLNGSYNAYGFTAPGSLYETLKDCNIPGLDDHLIADMLDTANAHKDNCAGLACIQIGINKRIILVRDGDDFKVFCNPAIVKRSAKTYMANEGCLSLDSTRAVKRHNSVMLSWITPKGKRNVKEFTGWIAEIIQHEVDHTYGKLI